MVLAAAAVDLTVDDVNNLCSAKRPRHFSVASGSKVGTDSCNRKDWEQEWLEANQCCICSEAWDSSGPRRVVALKQCGHLFCKECIEQWLAQADRTTAMCPTCRQRCVSFGYLFWRLQGPARAFCTAHSMIGRSECTRR